MKNRLLIAFPLLMSVALLAAAPSTFAEQMVARSYDIKNVTQVEVSGGGRIEIRQGDTESLHVEAESNVIDRVKVDLSGGKLTLGVKNTVKNGWNLFRWFDHNDDEVHYILQLKEMKYLGLSGASRATVSDWNAKDLAVHVSGAGEANFANLSLTDLFVDLSGASNFNVLAISGEKMKFGLSGAANTNIKGASQTKTLEVECSGASNFRGKLLAAIQADVGASGASNIEVNAADYLKAGASGASNVRYLGTPRLESNVSGASNLRAMK